MSDMAWKILGTGAATLAGTAAKKVTATGWNKTTGRDVPNHDNPDSGLAEAIAWAALSGAIIAIARMLATRQSAKYFAKSSGHLPEPMEEDPETMRAKAAGVSTEQLHGRTDRDTI